MPLWLIFRACRSGSSSSSRFCCCRFAPVRRWRCGSFCARAAARTRHGFRFWRARPVGRHFFSAAQADVDLRLRPRIDPCAVDVAVWRKVKKMKVTSNGGHVVISKTNFVIALAPYFFPLYAVHRHRRVCARAILFGAGRLVWFHLCVGAAYAFHVTLTFHTLKTRQSDITSQGYLFSAVVIFLGNVCVLLFGIPLLAAKFSSAGSLGWLFKDTGNFSLAAKNALSRAENLSIIRS